MIMLTATVVGLQ